MVVSASPPLYTMMEGKRMAKSRARKWLGTEISLRKAMIFMVCVLLLLVILAIFGVIHPSK